jgi:DNA polymerase III delta prime subunit
MSEVFNNLFVEKYRPKTIDEVVLSKEDKEFFESLRIKQEIPHLLFAGPAGTGKSATAKAIINDVLGGPNFLYINSSDESGIDTIRSRVVSFAQTKSFDGKMKVILLEEICGLTGPAQDALRNTIEEYSSNNRFIMTCNYLHKITKPIQSRCSIINLNPPLDGIVGRVVEILKKENITIPPEQKPLLLNHIKKNLPDLRRIINDIQKFSVSGVLNIRFDDCSEFAEGLFKKIQKQDLLQLRKEVIENEKVFSNDYSLLLKQLFEVIFQSSTDYEKKLNMLMIVSKSLENHSLAVDKEINFFSALISLSKAF